MVDDESYIDALLRQITSNHPDLVEIRLDKLRQRKLIEEIGKKKSFPAIATDRSGRSERTKLSELTLAVAAGFDFVDLEFTAANPAGIRQFKSEGASVILSFHDYLETPRKEQLTRVLEAQKKLGADICKLVTTAQHPRDNLTILDFVESEAANVRLVSFAMGREGVPSRILSPFFGAEFTFASLSTDSRTAEGQLNIEELRSAWQILGCQ